MTETTVVILAGDSGLEEYELAYELDWDICPIRGRHAIARVDVGAEVYCHTLKRSMTWAEMEERTAGDLDREWLEERLAEERDNEGPDSWHRYPATAWR